VKIFNAGVRDSFGVPYGAFGIPHRAVGTFNIPHSTFMIPNVIAGCDRKVELAELT
jgi:hypothetical protein